MECKLEGCGAAGEVPERLYLRKGSMTEAFAQPDMRSVVGSKDILLISINSLRYDTAVKEEQSGGTPVLSAHANWKKCFAPAPSTYASHHAIFSGFFPVPVESRNITEREMLFFPEGNGLGKASDKSFTFEDATWVEALQKAGYETNCVGGVRFFNKCTALGSVFPAMFMQSFWRPSFGSTVKKSIDNQVEFMCSRIAETSKDERVFYFLNASSVHYPNWFYLPGTERDMDTPQSHAAALRYTDTRLADLFSAFRLKNGEGGTFVMVLSDHGTSYGEDGFEFHGLPNPIVNVVPYMHFFI